MRTKLPDTLHELLDLALEDLKKISKDSRYLIDMGIYHEPSGYFTPCFVCLAGCVMANTLKANPFKSLHPMDFPPEISLKLTALNFLRQGEIYDAIVAFYSYKAYPNRKPLTFYLSYLPIPAYSENKLKFFKAMRKVSKLLKEKGI